MNNCLQYQASAPSNIAFIKYWGKADESKQWPANDSLSMTLSQLATTTTAAQINNNEHQVLFNGHHVQRADPHGQKIFKQLDFLSQRFTFQSKLRIVTANSFPTGCGIASSASGLAALTIASVAAWTESESFVTLEKKGFSRDILAHLSRMGSGSAGRSLWGGFVTWGAGLSPEHQTLEQKFPHSHWDLCDSVVLFSDEPKRISSTEGHRLAWSSPLFAPRQAILPERLKKLTSALEQRDIQSLGEILEQEALEMHAVMMSAKTPVFYFGDETAGFLAWLRQLRQQSNLQAYFTIDAGANVHVIYEKQSRSQLISLLEEKVGLDRLLHDEVGTGPTLTTVSDK